MENEKICMKSVLDEIDAMRSEIRGLRDKINSVSRENARCRSALLDFINMDKTLVCKFCGGKMNILIDKSDHDPIGVWNHNIYMARCTECGSSTGSHNLMSDLYDFLYGEVH